MARLEHIRLKLENWAKWCEQKGSGGLGYPSQSPFARWGMPAGPMEATIPLINEDALEINEAVDSLQFTQSHLYLVLQLTYAKGLPRHLVAKRMSRAESTISKNLEDADRALDRWLSDKQAQRQRKKSFTT